MNPFEIQTQQFGRELAAILNHDGIKILEVAFAALEDANFHDEAALVQAVAQILNRSKQL